MIGIVIVSHSQSIAEGVAELVEQMTQGKVALASAGGIDDPDNPLGTDAMKVFEAISAVYSEDGVVVLIDLGSALMSAETALEFLEPEQQPNVYLCPAPLVEGAVAAGVQASVGASVEDVLAEALSAYDAKRSQFPDADPVQTEVSTDDGEASTLVVTIPNRLGLHARPAARFVNITNNHKASVSIRKDDRTVNGKSINQVVTLGVRQGDEIEIIASGEGAAAVLADLQDLIDANLGDDDSDLPEDAPSGEVETTDATGGIGASPGYAVGSAVLLKRTMPEVETTTVDDPDAEWARIEQVISEVEQQLSDITAKLAESGKNSESAIFEAHRLILNDPALLDEVRSAILSKHVNAESAWAHQIEVIAVSYRDVDDEYIRERADDVQDVGRRVLAKLTGEEIVSFTLDTPAIVVADSLSPSDTAGLSPETVLGIITERGGTTSHSAIIARSMGIPAVVGAGSLVSSVREGQTVALDGQSGDIWVDPSTETYDRLSRLADEWRDERQSLKDTAHESAVTRDGHSIIVAANIGAVSDARLAVDFGAEGVGLFRSELIYMERDSAPTEDEQLTVYSEVCAIMADKPVILRTLDIGGDKPLPYLQAIQEENPFLGWRGIRFTLAHPDLFKTQLRAALRAAVESNLSIMFPMISTVDEVRKAKRLLEEAKDELREAGTLFDAEMPVGIMIEVPAAVVIADHLAQEVDFFSIGTNDLTQYLMAADRGNARVNDLVDALNPAVLQMIKQTVDAAHHAGISAYMCGELAGNPLATPLLVGMGLDELSMGAAAIPAVKARIRDLDMDSARNLVDEVLAQPTGEAVHACLRR